MKKISLTFLILSFLHFGYAQISKESFVYSIKGADSLSLDLYSTQQPTTASTPCVLFVFGGAFVGGDRNDTNYHHYFTGLAEHGIKVVSISYRLGLKGVTDLSVFHSSPLKKAIDMAVEDVQDATTWILQRCNDLNIDSAKIILSGSSSGAVTILQTALYNTNREAANSRLPPAFRYAGVIAFSGAMLSYTGTPAYKTTPPPTLFFHGTGDRIVPYKSVRLFNKGLFGSSTLAGSYKKRGYPYYIYRAKNLGHEVSVIPMITQVPLILDFIDRYVIAGQQLQIDMLVNDPSEKPMLTISAKALLKKLATK